MNRTPRRHLVTRNELDLLTYSLYRFHGRNMSKVGDAPPVYEEIDNPAFVGTSPSESNYKSDEPGGNSVPLGDPPAYSPCGEENTRPCPIYTTDYPRQIMPPGGVNSYAQYYYPNQPGYSNALSELTPHDLEVLARQRYRPDPFVSPFLVQSKHRKCGLCIFTLITIIMFIVIVVILTTKSMH